jgi:predicted flavoprotein YhiN
MKIELLEEIVYNIIKRLDNIEKRLDSIEPKQNQPQIKLASKQQIDYLIGLGGQTYPNMSSKQASYEIDKLLRQQKEKQTKQTEEWPELEKPTQEEIEREYTEIKEEDYI